MDKLPDEIFIYILKFCETAEIANTISIKTGIKRLYYLLCSKTNNLEGRHIDYGLCMTHKINMNMNPRNFKINLDLREFIKCHRMMRNKLYYILINAGNVGNAHNYILYETEDELYGQNTLNKIIDYCKRGIINEVDARGIENTYKIAETSFDGLTKYLRAANINCVKNGCYVIENINDIPESQNPDDTYYLNCINNETKVINISVRGLCLLNCISLNIKTKLDTRIYICSCEDINIQNDVRECILESCTGIQLKNCRKLYWIYIANCYGENIYDLINIRLCEFSSEYNVFEYIHNFDSGLYSYHILNTRIIKRRNDKYYLREDETIEELQKCIPEANI